MKRTTFILVLLLCPLLMLGQTRKKATSAKKSTTTRKTTTAKKTSTAKTATAKKATVNVSQGTLCDGHYYVDLGLPSGTLWATCNVGADSPTANGSYFAWGETKAKTVYKWSTYKWCNSKLNTLTKYCNDSESGVADNRMELDPADDAAYVNWGKGWRMPSKDQQDELRENCTWTWVKKTGLAGYIVKGPNGNTIFLPFAGSRDNKTLSFAGTVGTYWSRTLYPDTPHSTYCLNFNPDDINPGDINTDYNIRCYGQSVRAVRAAKN